VLQDYGRQVDVPLKAKKICYFLGKCVVITGASSGIGRVLAFWYLNNGARVAFVGRDILELDKIAKLYPAQAIVCVCDLSVDI
jgi:NADP-dependent 3-hydroxy acid dehydrogenase YdfG